MSRASAGDSVKPPVIKVVDTSRERTRRTYPDARHTAGVEEEHARTELIDDRYCAMPKALDGEDKGLEGRLQRRRQDRQVAARVSEGTNTGCWLCEGNECPLSTEDRL